MPVNTSSITQYINAEDEHLIVNHCEKVKSHCRALITVSTFIQLEPEITDLMCWDFIYHFRTMPFLLIYLNSASLL